MEDVVTKLLLHEKIIKEYVARNFGKKVFRLYVRHLFILIFPPWNLYVCAVSLFKLAIYYGFFCPKYMFTLYQIMYLGFYIIFLKEFSKLCFWCDKTWMFSLVIFSYNFLT